MKNSSKVAASAIILSVIACAFVFTVLMKSGLEEAAEVGAQTENRKTQATPAQTGDSWLTGTTDEKFAKIEKHLRGLDVTMAEIGYRYGELHFAARERNWDYAKYQTEKIDLSMRLALERRPKRDPSSQPFINEDVPAVMRAIESKNSAQLDRALERLHNSCISCHRSENVLHFSSTVERIRNNARR